MHEDLLTLQEDYGKLLEVVSKQQKDMDKLYQIINLFVKPDRYTFERPVVGGAKGLSIGSFGNIAIASAGLQIGAHSTDKLAFLGASPIAQQAAISAPSGGATVDSQARTAIAGLTAALQAIGITS